MKYIRIILYSKKPKFSKRFKRLILVPMECKFCRRSKGKSGAIILSKCNKCKKRVYLELRQHEVIGKCEGCNATDGNKCLKGCTCAKCLYPKEYEAWKRKNPEQYQEFVNSKVKGKFMQSGCDPKDFKKFRTGMQLNEEMIKLECKA